MTIEHKRYIYIKNFTVFKEEHLDFSKGINVIIGENGTGKTHLLKCIYAACEMSNEGNRDIDSISNYFVGALKKGEFFTKHIKPLVLLVRPQDDGIIKDKQYLMGELHINFINKSTNKTIQNIDVESEDEYSYEIGFPDKEQKALFIPAKEMLSHSKGFLALNNKYDMPFDKTYVDSITNAELPETKEISPLNEKLLKVISKIIDGKTVFSFF
ncbi:AAA family ATPase [Clostridium tagluense]|uniref:Rad50/SbcC-type AAA domain-containing protein n=1 Tax=Clostridium tagluense TaxID=360422 RepID=A0A401UTA0_9CLOT|nr:AAA family ATPase [Clostridium tagluense]GCD12736.1 hypothetical protein Ctaglu_43590 [Clostridium tagluense]